MDGKVDLSAHGLVGLRLRLSLGGTLRSTLGSALRLLTALRLSALRLSLWSALGLLTLLLRSCLRATLLSVAALTTLALGVDLLHLTHGEDLGKLAEVFLLHFDGLLAGGETLLDLLLYLGIGEHLGLFLLLGGLCLRLTLTGLGLCLGLRTLIVFLAFLVSLLLLRTGLGQCFLVLLVEGDELGSRLIIEHQALCQLLCAVVFLFLLGLSLLGSSGLTALLGLLGLTLLGHHHAAEGEACHEGYDCLFHL